MRLLVPLRDPSVALLWGGLSLSAIGDQLYMVAIVWIAVGLLGAWAGYLPALGAAMVLATALFAGCWADLVEPRPAMIAADVVRAAALGLAVAEWSLRGHVSVATLVGLTVILAAGQAVFRPALQGMLAPLVGVPSRLPATNALLDTTDRIARLLGPGLIAALGTVLPARHFLSLDAASFVASALVVMAIGRLRKLPPLRRAGAGEAFRDSVLRGFRAVAAHKLLALELRVSGALNGAWYAIVFLGLPLAINRLGTSAGLGAYGLVISAYGSTNLLATLLIGSRGMPANPGRMVFGGNLVMGIGMLLMAATAMASLGPHATVLGFAAAACVGAIGGPMHDIPVAVLRQTELVREDVAAAVRASLVVNNAGTLIAMAAVPAAYAVLPLAAVITGCAAIILAIGLFGISRFPSRGPAGTMIAGLENRGPSGQQPRRSQKRGGAQDDERVQPRGQE
ncbi:MAG TPA: MFS transporter [Acetobacteraceae bacterium]|nr:MFS transporter [Acetobacteraceae bacterium]